MADRPYPIYFFEQFSRGVSKVSSETQSNKKKTRAKLQPGASSPGAKQYRDWRTNQRTNQWTNQQMDEVPYRGAMLAPKNIKQGWYKTPGAKQFQQNQFSICGPLVVQGPQWVYRTPRSSWTPRGCWGPSDPRDKGDSWAPRDPHGPIGTLVSMGPWGSKGHQKSQAPWSSGSCGYPGVHGSTLGYLCVWDHYGTFALWDPEIGSWDKTS
jgi:hypothetical protein